MTSEQVYYLREAKDLIIKAIAITPLNKRLREALWLLKTELKETAVSKEEFVG